MKYPFPGMNPYLENPDLCSEVHHRLITAIAIAISHPLRPKYRVAIEKRTYRINAEDAILIGIPDLAILSAKQKSNSSTTAITTLPSGTENKSITVTLPLPLEIKEGYLEIREVSTGKVITVIELLSPTNKRTKAGRKFYLEKREKILQSATKLVEIDLIRSGEKMPILTNIPDIDYRILVVKSDCLPSAQLFAFTVREAIPNFTIPLGQQEQEIELNLQNLLLKIYEQAGFDLTLDYNQPPVPELLVKDREWIDVLLKKQGIGK
ncbi:DUF4058 family protein [Nostoc sp. CHAB 5844]|nr:DUF4058 family protein [Nostoc sp. CHAB 5844]